MQPKLPRNGPSAMPSQICALLFPLNNAPKAIAGAQRASDIDAGQRANLPWMPCLFGLPDLRALRAHWKNVSARLFTTWATRRSEHTAMRLPASAR